MHKQHGFTLIEIIIIAAIIALISVAVLMAINPIEQINRGDDTGTLQVSAEVYSAAIRSYVAKQAFPVKEDISGIVLSSTEGQAFLKDLEDSGDIKGTFLSNKDLDDIFITANVAEQQISLCFNPRSNSYNNHPLSGYDQTGQARENCADGECYICINGDNIVLVDHDTNPTSPSPSISQTQLTPTPTVVQIASWNRATTGENCNDYCASLGKTCTDVANSCPVFCFATAGGNQVEARWADLTGIRDPETGFTCWGSYSCATSFKYKPLIYFNARCCCE